MDWGVISRKMAWVLSEADMRVIVLIGASHLCFVRVRSKVMAASSEVFGSSLTSSSSESESSESSPGSKCSLSMK